MIAHGLSLAKVDIKHLLAKITSVALVVTSLYQIYLSLISVLFIYPRLANLQGHQTLSLEGSLIEKAIIIYISMMVTGAYGIGLLLKPSYQIKIAHIVVGVIIFIASIFFITYDPVTADPIQQFLLKQLR